MPIRVEIVFPIDHSYRPKVRGIHLLFPIVQTFNALVHFKALISCLVIWLIYLKGLLESSVGLGETIAHKNNRHLNLPS